MDEATTNEIRELPDSHISLVYVEEMFCKRKKLCDAQHARLEISENKKALIMKAIKNNCVLANVPLIDVTDAFIIEDGGNSTIIKVKWTKSGDKVYMTFHPTLTNGIDLRIIGQIVHTVRIKALRAGVLKFGLFHPGEWTPSFECSCISFKGLTGEYSCCKSTNKYSPGCQTKPSHNLRGKNDKATNNNAMFSAPTRDGNTYCLPPNSLNAPMRNRSINPVSDSVRAGREQHVNVVFNNVTTQEYQGPIENNERTQNSDISSEDVNILTE